jgi:hypothetical protein
MRFSAPLRLSVTACMGEGGVVEVMNAQCHGRLDTARKETATDGLQGDQFEAMREVSTTP